MGRMESIIVYEEHPKLERPVFIEGLPGVGNVGKIAADLLMESLGAKRFASIYSRHFPPQVTLDEDCIVEMANNELWYVRGVGGGADIIFLKGEYQGSTAEGQFDLARDMMGALLELDVSKIITLGGYGTGAMVDEPRVMGAANGEEIKEEMSEHGVLFRSGEPTAGIVGASGVFLGLGKIYGIPGVCLMGETSGYFVDHKSAMAIIGVLERFLGVEVDTADLKEKADQIDVLTAKVKEYEDTQNNEDLGYIG